MSFVAYKARKMEKISDRQKKASLYKEDHIPVESLDKS